MATIRKGTPTALFEDTRPNFTRVSGTSEPRQPQRNPMSRFQPPQSREKGPLNELWDLLGVSFDPVNVVWQDYNPSKYDFFPKEFVFITSGSGKEKAFNPESEITSGLQQMLLVFPGSFDKTENSKLAFTPLLKTGRDTGVIEVSRLREPGNLETFRTSTGKEYILAAHITGTKMVNAPENLPAGHPPLQKDDEDKNKQEAEINTVLVADTDLLSPIFFNLRAEGEEPDSDRIFLDLDNITFVMNVIDQLSGDERFIAIRKRRREHRTLTAFQEKVEEAQKDHKDSLEQYAKKTTEAIDEARKEMEETIRELQKTPGITQREFDIQVEAARARLQKELEVKQQRLEKQRDEKIQKAKIINFIMEKT